jgi:plastocyanin
MLGYNPAPEPVRRTTVRTSRYLSLIALALLIGAAPGLSAPAADPLTVAVRLKDHRFSPAEIHVPQGKRVDLVITNQDTTPEEFDSTALKVEKVIAGGTYSTVEVRPLGPGRYPFMGEFHPETAQGAVISE